MAKGKRCSNTNQEHIWKHDWDGEIFFSHGESNCEGVALLVSKNLDVNIDSITNDTNGRFLLLDCRISDIKYILVNLYAPNADKKLEQYYFDSYVHSNLENYIG